jgi:hypothetical protein
MTNSQDVCASDMDFIQVTADVSLPQHILAAVGVAECQSKQLVHAGICQGNLKHGAGSAAA